LIKHHQLTLQLGKQQTSRPVVGEEVQREIAYWNKQNNDVPAPNYMLKVRGKIIKVEGL